MMGNNKIGNVSFGCLEDKQIWILRGVVDSLNYIGKETNISNTENELRKLSVKQLNQVMKSIESLNISDVRERLINYIDTRINYFSGGDEMKSMNESIRDEIFVRELEEMKKIIKEDKL